MKTLFMIGAQEWAGVSKFVEEAGEALQVAGKLMGTQGAANHWDGTDLHERMTEEMSDVLAAADLVVFLNLNGDAVEERRRAKFRQFLGWHRDVLAHMEEPGAVVTGYRSPTDKRPPVDPRGCLPQPPWPPGDPDDANAKREGWFCYLEGRARDASPFPPARDDLTRAYQIGWDRAQSEDPELHLK